MRRAVLALPVAPAQVWVDGGAGVRMCRILPSPWSRATGSCLKSARPPFWRKWRVIPRWKRWTGLIPDTGWPCTRVSRHGGILKP